MPRGRAKKTVALIEACRDIIEPWQPMTVRGVCYQLFVRKIIANMGKDETSRVSRALVMAREDGLIPWDWIVDETRQVEHRPGFADPRAFLERVANGYRKDRWQDQPERVIVVSEKGTVGGVLRPIINRYGVPLVTYHGYASATALNDLADYSNEDSRPLTVLYVGDHDPSGRGMSDDDIPERLGRYGGNANIVRLAVTPGQIARHNLPTFSAHEKKTDRRYKWFLGRYGETCCELDALNPNLLRDAVESAILDHIDHGLWERAEIVQRAEIRSIREFLADYPATA